MWLIFTPINIGSLRFSLEYKTSHSTFWLSFIIVLLYRISAIDFLLMAHCLVESQNRNRDMYLNTCYSTYVFLNFFMRKE